jgi:septation ring formation regulator EzrA
MATVENSTVEIDAIKGNVSKVEGDLAVAVNSIKNLDEKEKASGNIVEKMREDLADARETIMGFGQDFVSRREWREAAKTSLQPVYPTHMVVQPSATPLPAAPMVPPTVAPEPESNTDSQQEPE